jgi:CBS domain containing-hemolysin-like protein
VKVDRWRLEVLKMERRAIVQVRVVPLPADADQPET